MGHVLIDGVPLLRWAFLFISGRRLTRTGDEQGHIRGPARHAEATARTKAFVKEAIVEPDEFQRIIQSGIYSYANNFFGRL
jgi:hypothetical protein